MALNPRSWFRSRGPSEVDKLREELRLTRQQMEADRTALQLQEQHFKQLAGRFMFSPSSAHVGESAELASEIALRESWPGWFTPSAFGAIINPLVGFYDGIQPLMSTVPTLWDYTLNLGFYVTEAWLDILRMYARVWYSVTPQAQGVMRGLRDYIIHTGFDYQVQPKPGAGRMRAALPDQCQRIVDDFLTKNEWFETESDWFLRLRRDGEYFGQLFPQDDGTTLLRSIEPWQVRGLNTTPENMFGVVTAKGDRERREYYRLTMSGNGTDAELIPAENMRDEEGRFIGRMFMGKTNTDKQVKRGVSDFVATQQLFRELSTLLTNTQVGEALRQALVWVQQTTGAGNPLVEIGPGGQTNAGSPPTFGQPITWGPGQIPTMDKNLEFKPGPVGNTTNAQSAMQLAYQALSVYFRVPEWMISGTSAANFASSLTQESPLVRMAQAEQKLLKDKFGAVVMMALRIAEEQELLEPGTVDKLVVNVEATPLVVREPSQETARNKTLKDSGLLSDRTWSVREELDYEAERENIEEEAAYKAAHPPAAASGQPGAPTDPSAQPAPNWEQSTTPAAEYARQAPRPEDDADPFASLMESYDDLDDDADSDEIDLREADAKQPVGVPYKSATGKSWLVNIDTGGGKVKAVRAKDPQKEEDRAATRHKKTEQVAQKNTAKEEAGKAKSAAKDEVGARKAKTKVAADKLAQGGADLTADDVKHLDEHFQTLTVDQMKSVARAIGAKIGGKKAELGKRLAEEAKKRAGAKSVAAQPATPAQPPAQTKSSALPPGVKTGADGNPIHGPTSTPQATEWLKGQSPEVVKAVTQYTTGDHFAALNDALRKTGEPPAKYTKMNAALQKAFASAPDLDPPVNVVRSMKLTRKEEAAFLEQVKQSQESGAPLEHKGYVSTSAIEQSQSTAPVLLRVKATKGIDITSVSHVSHENEMILNHGSKFKVVGVKIVTVNGPEGLPQEQTHVELEQVS